MPHERRRQHNGRCRGRCTPRLRSDLQARLRSKLLAKPLGHPSFGLFLIDDAPGFDVAQPVLDLLADVDVVLDVLQRGILGQVVKDLADSLFRALHGPTHSKRIARFPPRNRLEMPFAEAFQSWTGESAPRYLDPT
jgi:hypothetical protein